MAEYNQQHAYDQGHYQNEQHFNQVAKAVSAVAGGGSLLVLSGITVAGTVIALTIVTPLLVIFSPVVVPAVITVALLTVGFMASGGFGVAAVSVLTWIYWHVTGKQSAGSEEHEHTGSKGQGRDRGGIHTN